VFFKTGDEGIFWRLAIVPSDGQHRSNPKVRVADKSPLTTFSFGLVSMAKSSEQDDR
jgi:hypothetical protein